MLKIGLIRGRHQMPVDRYLIDTPEVDFAMAYVIAYCEAEELCKELGLKAWESQVDLFITGLTRATLGAIGGFLSRGVDVKVWEYNAQTGEYESVIAYVASPECPVGATGPRGRPHRVHRCGGR